MAVVAAEVPLVPVVVEVPPVVPVAAVPVVVVPVVAGVPDGVNVLPTAGVTTVVTVPVVPVVVVPLVVVPVVGVGGLPAGVNDASGGAGVGGVTGFPPGNRPPGAAPRALDGASGSTQFTSRLEQKAGMDVRSADRSAPCETPAPSAASATVRGVTSLRKSFINMQDRDD